MSTDLTDLTGKIAFITGAGSIGGQGEAEARLFVEHGARVVIADLPGSAGAEIADSLGDKAMFVPLDVTSPQQWAEAVALIEKTWGTVTVLLNTAGVWLMKGLEETSPEEYRRVIDVNQYGMYLGMAAIVPGMRRAGGGAIVNTCSVSGMKGGDQPFAYAASKWAVRGMTRSAAHELAQFGIRINSISPGVVDTPMIEGGPEVLDHLAAMVPNGRVARPQEVATIALFLASDASSYISGTEITADAALTA
ncbi:MAG: SDR family oxidoreductase [Microbacteriaceae bacterium]|nr:MAG: SDR family oxidoreductase [Microbacteriaceae bacterium]